MSVHMLEKWDRQLFELTNNRAVAITFSNAKPPGLSRRLSSQTSGCAFWKVAAEGNVFYTEPSDHLGCPMGAFTLGTELPDEEKQGLHDQASAMMQLSYMDEQEIERLPRRQPPLRYVIYAPLGMTPVFPDVVLINGNAVQLMLLGESAQAVGRLSESPALVKPACAMVPASLAADKMVLSLGCMGNPIYTGQGDHGYAAIPGSALEPICSRLAETLKAPALCKASKAGDMKLRSQAEARPGLRGQDIKIKL